MNAHKFASRTKIDAFQLKDFLGVDFTTHESEVNQKRSPDAINMISGMTGSVDKRNGFDFIHKFGQYSINKMYSTEYTYNSSTYKVQVVYTGDKFYFKTTETGSDWTEVKMVTNYVDVMTTPTTTSVYTFDVENLIPLIYNDYWFQTYGEKFIFVQGGWTNTINDVYVLHIAHSFTLPQKITVWLWNLSSYNKLTGTDPVSLHPDNKDKQFIYFPTTEIARTPNGLTSTEYEKTNNISYMVYNRFLSDGSSTSYNVKGSIGAVFGIWQMRDDGTFKSGAISSTGTSLTYTVDNINGIVTFSGVPHATYITGKDNIIILYTFVQSATTIHNSTHGGYDSGNKFKSYIPFGLSGNRNYAFLTNSSVYNNMEIWFRKENGIYFGSDFVSKLSNTQKIGYSVLGDNIVLHAKKENGQPTFYIKSASLDSEGYVIFPNKAGYSNVGTIYKDCFANLGDDPLWLSEAGVNAIVISTSSSIESAQDRGFYINERVFEILRENNEIEPLAFVYDNKYFLILGKDIFIADSRKKYIQKLAYGDSYQYDWYYWNNLYDIKSYLIDDDELYLGTSDGCIIKLKDSTSTNKYVDDVYDNGNTPTWSVSTDYEKNDIVVFDNNYFICLQDHNSYIIDTTNELYWNQISINTDNNTFEVPVYAYWTTPVMNMGNITMLKTLKNLWVRLGKYAHMSTRIYYSTKGLIKEEYDGVFDFSDIDFSRFTFSSDTDPSVMVTNRQERKFMSIQFKVESRDSNPFSLLEIVGKYIVNKQYKG